MSTAIVTATPGTVRTYEGRVPFPYGDMEVAGQGWYGASASRVFPPVPFDGRAAEDLVTRQHATRDFAPVDFNAFDVLTIHALHEKAIGVVVLLVRDSAGNQSQVDMAPSAPPSGAWVQYTASISGLEGLPPANLADITKLFLTNFGSDSSGGARWWIDKCRGSRVRTASAMAIGAQV